LAIYWILLKLTKRAAVSLPVAFLIAFGSTLWPYSRIGMEYPAVFLLAALFLSLLYWQEKKIPVLICGALLAFLALSKSYGIIFALPVFIFAWPALGEKQRLKYFFWDFLKLFGPAALSVAAALFINYHLYGNFSGVYSLKQEFQVWSWWEGWFGTFFAFGKSILLYNPLLILALFYWPAFFRKFRASAVFILATFFLLLLVTAPFSFWSDETLSVRKLMPIVPLLHLPLILAFGGDKFNKLKIFSLGLVVAAAFYFQLINSLYPYWRQLEILRPYNLDTLTAIRYNPRLSGLALNSQFFFSFIGDKLSGKSGNLTYFERSWMRCCTYPAEGDVTIAKINLNLSSFERPDTYIFSQAPAGRRKTFAGITFLAFAALSGLLAFNYRKLRRLEK
jgi:hypothetical protein